MRVPTIIEKVAAEKPLEGIGDLERAEDTGELRMAEMKLGRDGGREYGEGPTADVIKNVGAEEGPHDPSAQPRSGRA